MKSALTLVLLAAITASLGCGGGAAFVPASKPPAVVCNPPNMLVGGVCTTPTPAPTASLSANPITVVQGGSSTLTWQTTNATDVSIDVLGTVQASGSQSITPASSTTYTLTAKGAGGTKTATAMVTVTTAPPAPIVPAKNYSIIDLAPLPGDAAAQAQAIANGRVVGWSISNGVSKAVLWENGTVQSLGLGVAYAVNNLGDAAGYVPQGNRIFHAGLWNHDGTVLDLLTLNGFDSSLASGINDAGEVVGVSFSSQNPANQALFDGPLQPEYRRLTALQQRLQ